MTLLDDIGCPLLRRGDLAAVDQIAHLLDHTRLRGLDVLHPGRAQQRKLLPQTFCGALGHRPVNCAAQLLFRALQRQRKIRRLHLPQDPLDVPGIELGDIVESKQALIKLDVNQLADEVSNMDSVPEDNDSNLMSREELYGNVVSPNTPPTANQVRQSPMMEKVFKIDSSLLTESEQEEEYELDEDLLNEKTQLDLGQLDLDHNDVGYKGSSYGFDPTNHTKHDLQVSKLQQKLKDEKDKTVALMKSEKELKKEIKEVASAALKLSDKVKQYQSVVSTLKEKLDAFALSNAKLLYTNRVLSNASLNERQKNKIVETLSNAKTPDEAKTIFETLQSAVGSTNTNNAPKSLNEAVTRSVLSSISGRREQDTTQVPQLERMQILAGIKK